MSTYVSFKDKQTADEFFAENSDVKIITQYEHLENIFEITGNNTVDNEFTYCLNKSEGNSSQWHKQRLVTTTMPLRDAYDTISTGGAVIYLLDAGIDTEVDVLKDAMIKPLYSVSEDFSEGPAKHGSELAALIYDVSPDSEIRVVKVANWETKFEFGNLLKCLDVILGDHKQLGSTSVLNISWVMNKNQVLDAAIQQLSNAGIVVVAASGDQSRNVAEVSPARLDCVLTVGASDMYDRVLPFETGRGIMETNWGDQVNIFAPGIDVQTINGTASGSSIATAIASAVVAQYIEIYPNATAEEIRNTVLDNAHSDFLYVMTENTVSNKLLYALNNFYKAPWKFVDTNINFELGTGVQTVELKVLDTGTVTPSEYASMPHFVSLDGLTLSVDTDVQVDSGVYQFVLVFADNDHNEYSQIFKITMNDGMTEIKDGVYFYTTAGNNDKYSTGFSYAEMSTSKF